MSVATDTPAGTDVRSLRRTLGCYRQGAADPTTSLTASSFARATLTPDGPGTILLRWSHDHDRTPRVEVWGPGGPWLAERVDALTGSHDHPPSLDLPTPPLRRAARDLADLRIGASGTLYHELLPTVIAQRITAGEAVRQWRRLCLRLGAPAPGPLPLRLPPEPSLLVRRPAWWFHPLGIETSRARTIVEVARVADRLWDWAAAGPRTAAERLTGLAGVGPWTVGSVLGPALGDPDAVAVGDYHLKHAVSWAFASEARGTDERMLQLLAPYAGQRGRVVRIVTSSGLRAPAFGPRHRVLPLHRW